MPISTRDLPCHSLPLEYDHLKFLCLYLSKKVVLGLSTSTSSKWGFSFYMSLDTILLSTRSHCGYTEGKPPKLLSGPNLLGEFHTLTYYWWLKIQIKSHTQRPAHEDLQALPQHHFLLNWKIYWYIIIEERSIVWILMRFQLHSKGSTTQPLA